MQKKSASTFGICNPRLVVAIALFSVGASFGWLSWAGTPSSGQITTANALLTYDAGPFLISNQSPLGLGQVDKGPRCDDQFPCDSFALTVTLPPEYGDASNPATCN